jgi:DNA-binding transcriptional MocR family regulator
MVAAYDLLRQDERIIRRQGSGTRVAGPEPGGVRQTTSPPIFLHLLEPGDGVIPLACAVPDTPPPELAQAYARIVPTLVAPGDIGYYPVGRPTLRRAIPDRYTGRGIRTGPEHILVTTGAQQALSLLARALLAPGDQDYLRLHFVARADDLTEAVKRLADAWRAYRPPSPAISPPAMSV